MQRKAATRSPSPRPCPLPASPRDLNRRREVTKNPDQSCQSATWRRCCWYSGTGWRSWRGPQCGGPPGGLSPMVRAAPGPFTSCSAAPTRRNRIPGMPKRRAPAEKAPISSRPAFGDFLALAAESVSQHSDERVPGGEDVQQTCESLRRVVSVMRQYVQDPPRNVALFPAQKQPLSAEWDRARNEVRRALLQAHAWLSSPATMQARRRSGTHASWLAHRLGRSALALTTGRDLLYTHFAQSPEGTWYPRSEWAEVLASPQAYKAMLIEMAGIARVIAREGTRVATTPGWRGSPLARENRAKACQWLWILNASVQEANETDPVPAGPA